MKSFLRWSKWKEDEPIPPYERDYPRLVDSLPDNFDDDLHTKPDAHRAWRWDQQHGFWGYIDPSDKDAWLRHLDYYCELHRLADDSLGGTPTASVPAWSSQSTRGYCAGPPGWWAATAPCSNSSTHRPTT